MAIKTAQDILDEENVTPGSKHSSRDEEHDQVDEAYETISKKLESLRKGGDDEEKDDRNDSEKSEDQNSGESDNSEQSDKTESQSSSGSSEDVDPLDDEDTGDEPDEPAVKEEDSDPLDDIVDDDEQEEKEEKPMEPEKNPDEPSSLNDLVENESSDTHIPNLRPSQQESVLRQKPIMNESHFDAGEEFGPQDPDKFFNRHNSNLPARRSNKWHVLVLILIGIAVIAATVYLLKGQFKNNGAPEPSPSPSSEVSSSPSPSPSPEANRSAFKVRVLNGTGKTGLAKTVSDKLKGLGYNLDKTANATNSAFTQTVLRSKTSSASISAQLIKDLSPDYDALDQTNLKDNDPADFEIILGAK